MKRLNLPGSAPPFVKVDSPTYRSRRSVEHLRGEMARSGKPITNLVDLAHLSAKETWMQDASCAQTGDPEAWFPENGLSAAAKRVCRACPVQTPCLEYALTPPYEVGIWGGLTEHERRPLLKARKEAK